MALKLLTTAQHQLRSQHPHSTCPFGGWGPHAFPHSDLGGDKVIEDTSADMSQAAYHVDHLTPFIFHDNPISSSPSPSTTQRYSPTRGRVDDRPRAAIVTKPRHFRDLAIDDATDTSERPCNYSAIRID